MTEAKKILLEKKFNAKLQLLTTADIIAFLYREYNNNDDAVFYTWNRMFDEIEKRLTIEQFVKLCEELEA